VVFYDSNGVEIAPATGESRRVILRALGHDAFALGDRFPSVRNRQGLARFTSTGSSISGLGLRFNGRVSTFTSLPTLRGR
jgi:hypothetical protein